MSIHSLLAAFAEGAEDAVSQGAEKAEKILVGTEGMNGTQIAAMTIVGLAVVFAALLILVVFLYCSGGIFKRAAKPKSAPPAKAPQQKPKPAPAKQQPKAPAPAPQEDDSEVVAVIMAAIAAMGAAEGKQYKVRAVRQVKRGGSGRSVWAQAGIADATKPF